MLKRIAFILGLVSVFSVQAESFVEKYPQLKPVIQKLKIEESEIKEAPMQGFVQVDAEQGILYVSHDGKYLIHGNLYQIDNGQIENLTQKSVFEKMNTMHDEMIVYPAKNEKYIISAFVDITCGYCQQLHNDIKELNEAGITVRFLAFPRAGVEHESAKMMAKAWCAAEPTKALDKLMAGKALENDGSECEKIIRNQYILGHQMDISGTPAIVLDDGKIIPGYQPAAAMKAYFESREQK